MVGEGLHTSVTTIENNFVTLFSSSGLTRDGDNFFLQCNCLRALSRLYPMGKASQYGDRKSSHDFC